MLQTAHWEEAYEKHMSQIPLLPRPKKKERERERSREIIEVLSEWKLKIYPRYL